MSLPRLSLKTSKLDLSLRSFSRVMSVREVSIAAAATGAFTHQAGVLFPPVSRANRTKNVISKPAKLIFGRDRNPDVIVSKFITHTFTLYEVQSSFLRPAWKFLVVARSGLPECLESKNLIGTRPDCVGRPQ